MKRLFFSAAIILAGIYGCDMHDEARPQAEVLQDFNISYLSRSPYHSELVSLKEKQQEHIMSFGRDKHFNFDEVRLTELLTADQLTAMEQEELDNILHHMGFRTTDELAAYLQLMHQVGHDLMTRTNFPELDSETQTGILSEYFDLYLCKEHPAKGYCINMFSAMVNNAQSNLASHMIACVGASLGVGVLTSIWGGLGMFALCEGVALWNFSNQLDIALIEYENCS